MSTRPRPRDRFGLGWRADLADDLLAHLDRIDVLEVVAEHFVDAPAGAIKAMASLRSHVDLVLHGVSMGLASCRPVRPALITQTAQLVRRLRPSYWSEHLAFVRGGGHELDTLAAPPRNAQSVAATIRNIRRASARIGATPLLENAASVIEPPGSDRDPLTWLIEVLTGADCRLLLDLHNLHANAINAGFDALDFLRRIPPERIGAIHLAGGRSIGAGADELRLDTHSHDVPEPVYALLEEVGARVRQPLTIILEWDAALPAIDHLLAQLDRARVALARGRARQVVGAVPTTRAEAEALEALLARLYADPALQRRFLARTLPADPALSPALMDAVRGLDPRRVMVMAASSRGGAARLHGAEERVGR